MQEPIQYPTTVEEKELTLKDIILLVKEYFGELKRSWKTILFFIVPLAALLAISAFISPIYYQAKLTFLVTDDTEKGGFGDISKIIGSFGMPTGGQDESALEKVLQLFRSRQIIENTIFQKATVNGKTDLIANHMIEVYGWKRLLGSYQPMLPFFTPGWVGKLDKLEDFKYTRTKVDSFNVEENLTLKVLYDRVVGSDDDGIEPLVGSAIDEKSGIMSISLMTENEELTAQMLNSLYAQLGQYYIDKTIEKQKKIYDIATYKKDSIQAELESADKALAEFTDGNRALVWVAGTLTQTKLQRKARFLELLYGEAMKQAEMSDFALRNKTPYVQVIDEPARPILPRKKSWTSALMLGIAIGTVLGSIFVIARKVIRDTLAKD